MKVSWCRSKAIFKQFEIENLFPSIYCEEDALPWIIVKMQNICNLIG